MNAMNLKKPSEWRLYGILDTGYVAAKNAETMCEQMLEGGVDVLQLRAKQETPEQVLDLARRLVPLTRPAGVPLILNDHPSLVNESGADGFHVGQDDLDLAAARQVAGPDVWAGKSTHSVAQAVAGAGEGADYIGFGPLFGTPTKPDYTPIGLEQIAEVHSLVDVPIFCIGGIKLENLARVVAAGARRVVVVSGILQAQDPAAMCRELKAMLPLVSGMHSRPYS